MTITLRATSPRSLSATARARSSSERRLLGCTGGSNIPARDIPRIAALYRQGVLDLETLVSSRRPLEDLEADDGRVWTLLRWQPPLTP